MRRAQLRPDDLVVVSLPGAVLPGGFAISARKTYGHVSDGMICSTRELGTGDDHGGILVLDPRLEPDAARRRRDRAARPARRRHRVRDQPRPRLRAVAARGGARGRDRLRRAVPRPGAPRGATPNDDRYRVRVEAPDGCPVFVTRTVTGFDPTAPTPRWIARRVQLAGMRPISLAVDVTNYVMLELGQPIHGYDGDKLAGPIVVRRATEGEQLTTLDGVTRSCRPRTC